MALPAFAAYIGCSRFDDESAAAGSAPPTGKSTMSIEQFIDNEVKSNDVLLFMKGTPQFPMCGFSGQVVQILDYLGVPYKGLNVLENDDLRGGIKNREGFGDVMRRIFWFLRRRYCRSGRGCAVETQLSEKICWNAPMGI